MIKTTLTALTLAAVLTIASTAAYAQAAPQASTPLSPEAQKAKAELDTDGNGEVSKTEFMTYQEKRFAEMDSDGNGSVTDAEHKAATQKWIAKRNASKGVPAPTAAAPAAKQ